mmetsp:Transcript_44532/g.115221  ORF Transcript_44532/g.115221 Transcript_44532/m.115221 type:complete len:162 (+) Transcript_44532:591-1076(+)
MGKRDGPAPDCKLPGLLAPSCRSGECAGKGPDCALPGLLAPDPHRSGERAGEVPNCTLFAPPAVSRRCVECAAGEAGNISARLCGNGDVAGCAGEDAGEGDGIRVRSADGNAVPALLFGTGLCSMSKPPDVSQRGWSLMVPAGKRGVSCRRRGTPWKTSPE